MTEILIEIVNYAQSIYQDFHQILKENQFLAGIVGIWGIGVISFLFYRIPSQIYSFLERQFTTTLTLDNYNDNFYDFLRWFEKSWYRKLSRSLMYDENSDYYDEEEDNRLVKSSANKQNKQKNTLSAGYGRHFFMFKGNFFTFTRSKMEQSSFSEKTKEQITIKCLSRNQNKIENLLKAVEPPKKAGVRDYINIYGLDYIHWQSMGKFNKRPVESVVTENNIKEQIIDSIERWQNSKEWYLKNGINYKLGICLHGPPGTGKSSLIKAIASYFDKDIYTANANKLSDAGLDRIFNNTKKGSIILLEDIDSSSATHTRKKSKKNHEVKIESDFKPTSITGLLNAMDGISSYEDRILFITTNHIEKLDDALLREGRMDETFKLDHFGQKSVREFIHRFYPDQKKENIKFKGKVKPCKLQGLVEKHKNNFTALKKDLKKLEQ